MKRAYFQRRQTVASRWGFVTVIIILLAILLSWWGPAAQPLQVSDEESGQFSCQVASVTDGDTLRCVDGTRVRLHAVAARERDESCSPGHPCPTASGAMAAAVLGQLTAGQRLQCISTGASYGRLTAICRNETGTEINCAMVQSGTAVIWARYNSRHPICQR